MFQWEFYHGDECLRPSCHRKMGLHTHMHIVMEMLYLDFSVQVFRGMSRCPLHVLLAGSVAGHLKARPPAARG